MTTPGIDQVVVRRAIELATRAPSVHNSQPWRWLLGERVVHLHADRSRWLPATDPEGRDLVMSCGAALHHLRLALAAQGVHTQVHRLPDPEEPDHLATVDLGHGDAPPNHLDLLSAITCRRSDRRALSTWRVPDHVLELVVSAAGEQGAVLRVVTGTDRRQLVEALLEAAATQEGSPAYCDELARWTGGRITADDGIPAANLMRDPTDGGDLVRHFAGGDLEHAEPDLPDGAVVTVLGTIADDAVSRLRAGEALSAALLLATRLGLATCPISQPMEVTTTRLKIRDRVLGGELEPHVLLRLGWPPAGHSLPATPRRPVHAIVEPLPR